jgi:hypothetical protein
MKAAVNNLNSQYNASNCTSKPQTFGKKYYSYRNFYQKKFAAFLGVSYLILIFVWAIEEHRLSGAEFRSQGNMDNSNSGPFHNGQRSDPVATFKNEHSRSNMKMKGSSQGNMI